MRLGIGTFAYPWAIGVPGHEPPHRMTAMELLHEALRLKVKVVQFCDNLPLDKLNENSLDSVETFARAHGLEIELGIRGTDPALLSRYLSLARRFGCKFLRTVVPTGNRPLDDRQIRHDLDHVLPAFQRANVKIALENHDWHSLQQLERIVTECGTGLAGFCFDTVNSLGFRDGLDGVALLLASRTLNLHIKDYTIKRLPSQLGFRVEGCAVGAGELDVAWLLRQLRQCNRDVNAIIELWTPQEESIAQTISSERTLAEQNVAYLRQHIAE